MTELEPIEPDRALELYLEDREIEYADSTIRSHRSRLKQFLSWCDEEEITNLNTLTGRMLQEYRLWRRREGDLSTASVKTQMDTLRVFIRWLESIDAVEADLHTKVQSPKLTADENSRDVMLEQETAEEILGYLRKYRYGSLEHVTLALLWHTMMRRGTARALDVNDYDPEGQYIEVVHRPETDTPIKNGADGERLVALDSRLCSLLDDWIADQRPDVEDDYGRRPLLASAQGRVHYSTVQRYCYGVTRPCTYTGECPHGREIESCEATKLNSASKCPSSLSPHAVRRGSITHYLQQDVPEKAVSDRANVSPEVIDQHYDRRSKREKMEQRRRYLDDI